MAVHTNQNPFILTASDTGTQFSSPIFVTTVVVSGFAGAIPVSALVLDRSGNVIVDVIMQLNNMIHTLEVYGTFDGIGDITIVGSVFVSIFHKPR